MAQLLVQRALNPAQHEQARAILDSGIMLKVLLGDVLDLSKMEAGRMELALADHDMRLVFERIRQTWEPQARRKGIAVRLNVDEHVPEILRFNPTRLEQCVSNLVSNAIKFTESGEIGIGLCRQEAPAGDDARRCHRFGHGMSVARKRRGNCSGRSRGDASVLRGVSAGPGWASSLRASWPR